MRYSVWIWTLTVVLILVSTVVAQYQFPPIRKYPSSLVGIVIPGAWENPTDPATVSQFISEYGSATANEVKRWEFENSDIFVGGDYGLSWNPQKPVLQYEYFHTIVEPADSLKKRAILNGVNWEDFSLHYTTDTIINTTVIGVTGSYWVGILDAGSTERDTHYGVRLSDSRDVFRGVANGGAFFVWSPLPFTEIHVTLQHNGVGGSGLIVEFPSSVDVNNGFVVTQWSQATILEDTTNNFSQSGTIRIAFPPTWKYAALYPPHGFYYPYLVSGRGGAYALRIKCFNFSQRPHVASVRTTPALEYLDGEPYVGVYHSGTAQSGGVNTITLAESASSSNNAYNDMQIKIVTGTGAGQVRIVTGYSGSTRVATVSQNWDTVPDSTSQYKIVRRVVRIRGWDPANDQNGDGWVSDSEFANLQNPNATARFRHQARLIYTNAWANTSSWNVANVWNHTYRQYVAEDIRDRYQANGHKGFYIDDALGNGLGSQWVSRHKAELPAVLQGGYIHEYNDGRVDQDNPTNMAWYTEYAQLIQAVKTVIGSQWIGANIANEDPFSNPWLTNYLNPVLDWYLCEDVLHSGWAADGWGGISVRLGRIYPGLSYLGKKKFLIGHVRNITSATNTQDTWERKLYELTVLYYLIQTPGLSYMSWWNSSYSYGSGNTIVNTGFNGFWKAGVPRNFAYRPHGLLSVDIGVPANTIPPGKKPIDLLEARTEKKVGTSASFVLQHSDGRQVPVLPTYIYIFHQIDPRNWTSPPDNGKSIPFDAVYARKYTKGLVLYRTLAQYSGLWTGYDNGNPVKVQLPGTYRKVNYDGTLGPPVTEIQIRGFEGIVLQDATVTAAPNIQLAVSVDKQDPKPMDVVTVTITATNVDSGEALNVRIQHDISPEATFIQGSLQVNNEAQPDPLDPKKIDITIPAIPGQGQATVRFQVVIRRP